MVDTAKRSSRSKRTVADEAWGNLLRYWWSRQSHLLQLLQSYEMSPGDMKALFSLSPDEPQPMGGLADALACDASAATWFVDRLEERGLAERRQLPNDRRVRTIVLTPKGVKTRAELLERLYEAPDPFAGLDRHTLEVIRDAFASLQPDSSIPDFGGAGR
jgi:DNA-binding MarR family transcriptional regulator